MGIKPALMNDGMRRGLPPEEKARLGNLGKSYDEIVKDSDDTLESKLQSDAINHLTTFRGLHVVGHALTGKSSTMRPIGWPDLVFCIRGHLCAIELKVGRNKPSDAQITVLTQLIQDGAWVAVCNGWQEFLEKVREWFGDNKEEEPHHD